MTFQVTHIGQVLEPKKQCPPRVKAKLKGIVYLKSSHCESHVVSGRAFPCGLRAPTVNRADVSALVARMPEAERVGSADVVCARSR
jgi:hypothetical protein